MRIESDLEKAYSIHGRMELSDQQIKELWTLDGKGKDKGKHPSHFNNQKRLEASKAELLTKE